MNPRLPKLVLGSLILMLISVSCTDTQSTDQEDTRPNILVVISDDQSYPHTSIYGYKAVNTPGFDRIASEGILFTQAFAASPGCSPSRAALLTGRNCWQIEAAGTHASHFDTTYVTFPDLLENAGYHIGYTGKGWGPGNYKISGRERNPAGPSWDKYELDAPEGINKKDYAKNFEAFLNKKPRNSPFCFWLGTHEPHRSFKQGIGIENGKDPSSVEVPAFLPDHEEVRSDILDYCYEIEWFDNHLVRAIELLEESGELENTIIIVTADNGMAFPRAKANVYEYGIHVPMALRWGAKVDSGRVVDDLVGFIDIAPTILEAAGVEHPGGYPMAGKSMMNILRSDQHGIVDSTRTGIFSSRERHSSVRYHSLSYPQRSLRTHRYLYIRNFKPERWPAGAPQKIGTGNYPSTEQVNNKELGPMHDAYHDIDGCPTLDFMVAHREDSVYGKYLNLAVAHRPAVELYDMRNDPFCLNNLSGNPDYAIDEALLSDQMQAYLTQTGDPRVTGNGDIWETYPRYSRLRMFPEPDWAVDHPEWVPELPWLSEHWEAQLQ